MSGPIKLDHILIKSDKIVPIDRPFIEGQSDPYRPPYLPFPQELDTYIVNYPDNPLKGIQFYSIPKW
ncbi:MAG: hypothetical protein KC535_02705 [Nanoarchaeota archaeon]|nr:hypothetical protein [Nanoarchaeota archaeon]